MKWSAALATLVPVAPVTVTSTAPGLFVAAATAMIWELGLRPKLEAGTPPKLTLVISVKLAPEIVDLEKAFPKGSVAGMVGDVSYQYRLLGSGSQDMTWVMSGSKIVGVNIAG